MQPINAVNWCRCSGLDSHQATGFTCPRNDCRRHRSFFFLFWLLAPAKKALRRCPFSWIKSVTKRKSLNWQLSETAVLVLKTWQESFISGPLHHFRSTFLPISKFSLAKTEIFWQGNQPSWALFLFPVDASPVQSCQVCGGEPETSVDKAESQAIRLTTTQRPWIAQQYGN